MIPLITMCAIFQQLDMTTPLPETSRLDHATDTIDRLLNRALHLDRKLIGASTPRTTGREPRCGRMINRRRTGATRMLVTHVLTRRVTAATLVRGGASKLRIRIEGGTKHTSASMIVKHL